MVCPNYFSLPLPSKEQKSNRNFPLSFPNQLRDTITIEQKITNYCSKLAMTAAMFPSLLEGSKMEKKRSVSFSRHTSVLCRGNKSFKIPLLDFLKFKDLLIWVFTHKIFYDFSHQKTTKDEIA